MRLSEQPWWTKADEAEWEQHFKEFFDVAWDHLREHRAKHPAVRNADQVIAQEAYERLMLWRQARIIASKAQFFAAQEYERRRTNDG